MTNNPSCEVILDRLAHLKNYEPIITVIEINHFFVSTSHALKYE